MMMHPSLDGHTLKDTIVWTILSFLETKSRKEGILSIYILIFIKNLQLSMFISVFSVFVHENAH